MTGCRRTQDSPSLPPVPPHPAPRLPHRGCRWICPGPQETIFSSGSTRGTRQALPWLRWGEAAPEAAAHNLAGAVASTQGLGQQSWAQLAFRVPVTLSLAHFITPHVWLEPHPCGGRCRPLTPAAPTLVEVCLPHQRILTLATRSEQPQSCRVLTHQHEQQMASRHPLFFVPPWKLKVSVLRALLCLGPAT